MIKYDVVVHGKWVKDEGEEDYHCCSKCGQAVADECVPWFKFCPNCGAHMKDGDSNGQD